jgi:hypothetical protein
VLEPFLVPQLDVNCVTWKGDGAPTHNHRDVTRYVNLTFPERWTDRGGYIAWPPRSPDLTLMNFSFWVFVNDNVYIPPIPVGVHELRDRICNATTVVDIIFLNKLREEFEYRLDVCRITRGNYTEQS